MISEFTELAHGSTTAEEFEAHVLSALERHVGCDVAFFSVKGREARPSTLGFERHVVKQAVRGGVVYERELVPIKAAALARRGVAVDTEVLGEDGVRRMRYFREVASLVGGRHSLFGLLRFQGRPIASVMLGRTGAAFSERDVSRVESVLPAITLGRAAFGWPYRAEPLRRADRGFIERWGFGGSGVRARVETESGQVLVRDRGGYREMVARQGERELVWTRAALEDAGRSGWPYVDLLHLAAALSSARTRALFIGCGGGVAVRQFAERYPGLAIDVVEREPSVLEMARDWFGLGTLRGVRAHVGDGDAFVRAAEPGTYDIAVVDAYDAGSIATPLTSAAFFRALSRSLSPGGAAAFNVIGTLARSGTTRDVARAASATFEDVRLVPVLGLDETYAAETLRNVVIVAARPRTRG